MSSNILITRVCEHCKLEFTAKTTITRFCSHQCNRAAYRLKAKEAKCEKGEKRITQSDEVKVEPLAEIMLKTYYTLDDLSQLFGLSKRTFYRIIERGELPHAKLGGKTFVHKDAINELFKKEK